MDNLLAEAEKQFDEALLREELASLVPSRLIPFDKGTITIPCMHHLVIQYPDEGTVQEQVARSKNNFLQRGIKSHAKCVQNCGMGLVYDAKLYVVSPPRLIRGEGDGLECSLTVAYFLIIDCSVGHANPVTCNHGRTHRR